MHIEFTALLGFAGSAIAGAVSIYLAILRYALGQKEKDYERRFAECERASMKLDARMNEEEKATIRQDGQINLVHNNHDALTRDLEEIKRTMITKAEFDPRMTHLERTLNQILSELRGGRTTSHGQMPAVIPPKR